MLILESENYSMNISTRIYREVWSTKEGMLYVTDAFNFYARNIFPESVKIVEAGMKVNDK